MKYILAEKPQSAQKIAAAFASKKKADHIEILPCSTFPKGAIVGYCIGHLLELYYPENYHPEWKPWYLHTLPIIPQEFKKQVSKDKVKALKAIEKHIHDSRITEVIIATDPAREGSYIGWEVIYYLKVRKPIKRLWTSSLTKSAIVKGFTQLKDGKDDLNYYYEAHARAISDWLVGINLSRGVTLFLRKHGVNHGVFPVGRVMTPLLRIIVDREIAIRNFKVEDYWTVWANFHMSGKEYRGKWFHLKNDRLSTEKEAEHLVSRLKGKKAKVQKVEKERKVYKAPQLFNLSSLQTTANKKFKYSPKRTLEIAQKLYDNQYLTYPRTDSAYITDEEARELPAILNGLAQYPEYQTLLPPPKKSLMGDSRYVNPKLVSDHHGLLVTDQFPNLSALSTEERNIYDLVARSVIAAHYEDAIFDYTSIVTEVDGETFSSKGKQLIQEGWRRVLFPNGQKGEGEKEGENSLPPINEHETGIAKSLEWKKEKTKPPARLTQGNLINVMKYPSKYMKGEEIEDLEEEMVTAAIGTEATRAGIIDKLILQQLIQVNRNQVFATEKGILLIEALGRDMVICSPELTAKWEAVLSKIGKGQFSHQNFTEKSKELTIKLLKDLKSVSATWNFQSNIERMKREKRIGSCPKCKKGDVIHRGTFYGCSQFQESGCTFTLNQTIAGKKISETQVKKLLTKGETDTIKGFKSSKGNTFDTFLYWCENDQKIQFGFLRNKDDKQVPQSKEIEVACPFCGRPIREYEKFYGCPGYKEDCQFSFSKTYLGVTLPPMEIQNLLMRGKTEVLGGFVGKYGTINGQLYIDERERKVKFRYIQ